jgi:hypothetical protein
MLGHAMGLNIYENGCLVPFATYNDEGDTSVGLSVRLNIGNIYWNFISVDGVNLASGSFNVELGNTWNYPFSLKTSDGNSHPNTPGYLIFTNDDNGTLTTTEDSNNLYGNAVLLSVGDAAFLPVIPLTRSDYATTDLDLNNLNGASLVALSYGHRSTAAATDIRYWIDPAFGATTSLVIWTCQAAPASFNGFINSVTGGPVTGIPMNPFHTHLNMFDVASITGIPAGFVDGSIAVAASGSDRLIFSIIGSGTFSAKQTLLGADAL